MIGMRGVRSAAMGAAALLLLVVAAFALTFPPLTGRVVDNANILDEATRQALSDKLAAVEAKT